VLAFQMLTGQVPFDAESVITIIQHHYFTPVPDVRLVREGVPEELLSVVYRALAKDASQRYASTRDMVHAVEAVPCTAEEKAQSEELLRQLARGEPVPKIRTGSLPPLADARTIGAAMLAGGLPTINTTPTITAPAPRKPAPAARRRRGPLLAAAAVVVVLGSAGAYLALRGGASAAPTGQAAASAAAGAGASGTSTSAPPPAPPVAPAGAESAAPATKPPAETGTAPAPTPERRPRTAARPRVQPQATEPAAAPAPLGSGLIRVRTVPPNAQVFVDGRKIGDGSAYDVEIAAGRRRLRITAAGYITLDTTITVEPNATLNLGTKTLRSEGGP